MDLFNHTITLENRNPILTLDISPDGEFLIIGQQGDYFGNANLTLLGIKEMEVLAEIEKLKYYLLEAARFMQNNKSIVYAKNTENVCIYNFKTQEHLDTCFNTANVIWLAPAKKNNRLITAGLVTEVWDVNDFERVWTMADYVAFSSLNLRPAVADITPDGTKVLVAGKNIDKILIYDIEHDEIIQELNNGPVQARLARLGPDQRYFAVIEALSRGIFIWNLENGERYLPHIFSSDFDGYWSLCFHPKGEYIAVGTLVGYISIFRLSDGKTIFSKKTHQGRVWDLAFTPDGEYLVSGGDDGNVSIIELKELFES